MPTLPLSLAMLVVCCLATIALGYPFVGLLRRLGVGKRIRDDGPSRHDTKSGTPTMGGLLICGLVLVVTTVATLTVHQREGDMSRVFDGRNGFFMLPLTVVEEYSWTKGALEGARLEAELLFPARIKEFLGNWRVSYPATLDGRDVHVVQGSGAQELLASCLERLTVERAPACSLQRGGGRNPQLLGRSALELLVQADRLLEMESLDL